MKKISVALCLLLASSSAFANNTNFYNTGKGFIGPEIGIGGIGNVSIGVIGGYQFYFQEDWQFSGFRHGVRGFASANWTQYTNGFFSGTSYNGLFVQVGSDWTIDFNINDRFVYGAYVGLSLGYVGVFTNEVSPRSFLISGNLGGSVTIDKTHRLELALGSGFSVLALRYLYMF